MIVKYKEGNKILICFLRQANKNFSLNFFIGFFFINRSIKKRDCKIWTNEIKIEKLLASGSISQISKY